MANESLAQNGSFSNWTTTSIAPLTVTPLTLFTAFAIFATCAGNGLIIFVYATRKALRTPFNSYIVNIAIAEFILSLTTLPGSFLRSFYGYWPLDAVACSFYTYFSQIAGPGVRYGHALVTANRIWAVAYPLNYRTYHTDQVAKGLIVGSWIFQHLVNLPRIFIVRLPMGSSATDRECAESAENLVGYGIATEMVGFDLPELFIVLTFPFFMIKLRQLHINRNKINPGVRPSTKAHFNSMSSTSNDNFTLPKSLSGTAIIAARQTSNEYAIKVQESKPGGRNTRSHNRVMIYFVMGIIICWTPNHVFFLIVVTKHGWWEPTFATTMFVLQYIYSFMNPVLCYLAMKDLRQAVDDVIFCRRCV